MEWEEATSVVTVSAVTGKPIAPHDLPEVLTAIMLEIAHLRAMLRDLTSIH